MLQTYRIKAWRTANYHAQANATEAVNKTIGNILRAYLLESNEHQNWDTQLAELTCALNSSKHTQTGQTPFEVNFGHTLITAGDQYEDVADINSPLRPAYEDKWRKIREDITNRLKTAYEENKKRYDLRSRQITYNVGDIVWRKNFKLSNKSEKYSAKLSPKYIKCLIEKKIGTNVYQLRDMDGTYCGNFSTKDMKP